MTGNEYRIMRKKTIEGVRRMDRETREVEGSKGIQFERNVRDIVGEVGRLLGCQRRKVSWVLFLPF